MRASAGQDVSGVDWDPFPWARFTERTARRLALIRWISVASSAPGRRARGGWMTATGWLRRFTPANLAFLLMNLVGLAFFLYPFWAPTLPATSQSRAAFWFSGAASLVLLALIAEAQHGLTLHTIAILGALVGLNTVLRVIDNVVPLPGGFSPVYLLILLVGFTLGSRLGFMMGALTMLVSGPLTAGGIGPWTPYQMMAAGWVGLGDAWLPSRR
jgi:hypothetical protein